METKLRPQLSWEYIGEELAVFWINPYPAVQGIPSGGKKEKIASFWWPFHPTENTKEVENPFEAIADTLVKAWNNHHDATRIRELEQLIRQDVKLLDPEMPAQELRLHMGEMTSGEIRTARAAIAWANTRIASSQGER